MVVLAVMQVGEAFSSNKTVTVAKMDATANDVPSDKFSVRLLVNFTPFANNEAHTSMSQLLLSF